LGWWVVGGGGVVGGVVCVLGWGGWGGGLGGVGGVGWLGVFFFVLSLEGDQEEPEEIPVIKNKHQSDCRKERASQ